MHFKTTRPFAYLATTTLNYRVRLVIGTFGDCITGTGREAAPGRYCSAWLIRCL